MSLRRGLLALALLSSPVNAAEVLVEAHGSNLRIHAVDATTQEIFSAVADLTGLEVFSATPLDRIVSIQLRDVRLPLLVRRLVRDESYLLIREDGRHRLWIYSNDTSARVVTVLPTRTRDEDSWHSLLDDLNSDDPVRRADAVFALANDDAVPSIDLLRSALHDSDSAVQIAAIEVLGELGANTVLQENWSVLAADRKMDVVDAIGDNTGPGRLAILHTIAGQEDPLLAAAARQYLEEGSR